MEENMKNNETMSQIEIIIPYVKEKIKVLHALKEHNKKVRYPQLLESYKMCFIPDEVGSREKSYAFTPYAKIIIDKNAKPLIECINTYCLYYENELTQCVNHIKDQGFLLADRDHVGQDATEWHDLEMYCFAYSDSFFKDLIIDNSRESFRITSDKFNEMLCTGKTESDYYANLNEAAIQLQSIFNAASECLLNEKGYDSLSSNELALCIYLDITGIHDHLHSVVNKAYQSIIWELEHF